jgi:hypothetical protein
MDGALRATECRASTPIGLPGSRLHERLVLHLHKPDSTFLLGVPVYESGRSCAIESHGQAVAPPGWS